MFRLNLAKFKMSSTCAVGLLTDLLYRSRRFGDFLKACTSIGSRHTLCPLRCLLKPLSPRRGDKHAKHSWNTIPKDWEILGYPPSVITIDLHITLKPHSENTLIDLLHEVSRLVI
jgi:hypothetical protein